MASLINNELKLSIIIPTLNEEGRLRALFSKLSQFDEEKEIIIVDGGSNDGTLNLANALGAKTISCTESNRGKQLRQGACIATGRWFLFLHADSKLYNNWSYLVSKAMAENSSSSKAWFFDFKINLKGWHFRLLELGVSLRSHFFQRPYGDQGLLIAKSLYRELGGFSEIPLMEDLEFAIRISEVAVFKGLGNGIETDGRKWEDKNILLIALENLKLRRRWRAGENPRELFHDYYKASNKFNK